MLICLDLHALCFMACFPMLCFFFCSMFMLGLHAHMLDITFLAVPCLDLHVYMHVSMPICLDLCFHMFVCLDLCSLHALYYLPCVFALHTMFICLGLDLVCHGMCYCSFFVPFIAFSCVLPYWLELDQDPLVFVIIRTPRPTSKGLDHSRFACLCLLASMLYACVGLFCSRPCHV